MSSENFKFEKSREFVSMGSEINQNEKNFKENICGICEKKLSSKYHLMRHIKNIHSNKISTKIYFCDHCGLKYFNKNCLIKHLKSKHQKGKEIKFECDFDGKIFDSKPKLSDHMRNHQIAVKECKICEKKVKNFYDHMKYVHAENVDKVDCLICNKSFKNQKYLKNHLKSHNKQNQCQVCGRKFALLGHLNQHMKVHEDKFAFRCDKCQKNFNSSSSLKYHLKTHDKSRSKKQKCQFCDYSTDHKKNSDKSS